MSEPVKTSPTLDHKSKLRGLFSQKSPLRYFSYCLILLSLADLLTTYILLQTSHRFYEGNPIANFFFHRWNILGMTLFKFSLVAIVIVVSEIVERFRPGLGKLLLTLACAASAYVVVYGIELFFEHAI